MRPDAIQSKALHKWAGTVKGELLRARLPLESLWRDIRDNFEPTLGRALDDERDLNESAAKRGDERIVNSKVRDVVSRLSSGLQSGITNQARQWFRLMDRNQAKPDGNTSQERRSIDTATELLQSTIAGSNVYTALISLYMRLGQFGTACALLVPDEFTTVRLDVIDEGAYWLGQDRRGRVCTLLRRCDWTIRQIVESFGAENVPDDLRREYENGNLETPRRCWNLVCPMREVPAAERGVFGEHPFASLYWIDGDRDADTFVAARGYDYNPIIAPRWSTPTGSVYGLGLGQKALPDAKELQLFARTERKIVAQDADPPMAVPERMRGKRISLAPGAINYYAEGSAGTGGGHIPIQPIDARQKRLDEIEMLIGNQEQRLGRLFFEDLFAMLLQIQMGDGKRQMTATEVSELASEKIALLGPILTRLNHDLLDPLVGGVYAICRAEALDRLDAIRGAETLGYGVSGDETIAAAERYQALADIEDMELDVEYTSTLHIQQQANSRIAGIVELYQFAGMIANYDGQALDNLDSDEAVRLGAKSYMEFGVIRDRKQVADIREGRAAQLEQQMRMAQAKNDADVQKQQADILKTIADSQAANGGTALAPEGSIA
jgi:hypothetical protein